MRVTSVDSSQQPLPKLAPVVAAGCVAIAIAVPVWVILQWAMGSPASLVSGHFSPISAEVLAPQGEIPVWRRVVGAAGSLIPALIMSWGWLQACAALRSIGQDRVFAPIVTAGLKGYAAACFWSAIASFVLMPVMSVALTFANGPGHRVLSFGASSNQAFGILEAGVVWIIVAALARGAQAAEENRQFI